MKRLRQVEKPLANFFASGLFELRDKLGPLLWQLPPTFTYDAERLDAFFTQLPRTTERALSLARRRDARIKGRARLAIDRSRRIRHAVEIRHESFLDPSFIALLRRHRIALVVADTAGKWPYCEDVTADFVYLRLHGDEELYASGYSESALDRWAERIAAWSTGSEPRDARRISDATVPRRRHRDVYCYFDNDIKVKAPFDAQRLIRKLASRVQQGTPGRSHRCAARTGSEAARSAPRPVNSPSRRASAPRNACERPEISAAGSRVGCGSTGDSGHRPVCGSSPIVLETSSHIPLGYVSGGSASARAGIRSPVCKGTRADCLGRVRIGTYHASGRPAPDEVSPES